MITSSPTIPPIVSGYVTIVFMSDWGVSTSVGHVGRTHSTTEYCGDDLVVCGAVTTRVLREQAMLTAKTLDGQKDGKWTNFALWLFGQDPKSKLDPAPHPRHVPFSDAASVSLIPVHGTVSFPIDPKTGTTHDQFLRFTECAATDTLTGMFTLIDEAGVSPSDQTTIDAAHFLLGAASLVVRDIGSGRSGGDGEYAVAISDEDYTKIDLQDEETTDALTRILVNRDNDDSPTYSSTDVRAFADYLRSRVRESLREIPAPSKNLPKDSPQDIVMPDLQQSESGSAAWYETPLDIILEFPAISYEVPFSNEVRSLGSLRETVLVP